eukprot:s491_g4.t1
MMKLVSILFSIQLLHAAGWGQWIDIGVNNWKVQFCSRSDFLQETGLKWLHLSQQLVQVQEDKLMGRPRVDSVVQMLHYAWEAEISGWRDWSWQFEQYIASVDAKFSDDIQYVRAHLDRTVDPVDFSDAEKQRNTFLYSLLSSLVRQRALLVVRQVTGCNGLEAYRTLIQQNEPISKNRSMGLLNLIMNWPTFSNKMSLMQNVLKLEHAYAEYEKLGSRLNDDLKTAI